MRVVFQVVAVVVVVGCSCFHPNLATASSLSSGAGNRHSSSHTLTRGTTTTTSPPVLLSLTNSTRSSSKRQHASTTKDKKELSLESSSLTPSFNSSSSSSSSSFSFGKKWLAGKKSNNNSSRTSSTALSSPPGESTLSSTTTTATTTTPRKKVKSDRERGWPLWYPRDHNMDNIDNDTTAASKRQKQKSSQQQQRGTNDHSEDSKISRTLRQALTHYHSPTNHSSSTSNHSRPYSDHDSKTVEELKIVLLEPDQHHDKDHPQRHHRQQDTKKKVSEIIIPAAPLHDDHDHDHNSNTTTSSPSLSENHTSTTNANTTAVSPTDQPTSADTVTPQLPPQQQQEQPQQQLQQQQQQQPNIIVLGGTPFGLPMGLGDQVVPRRIPVHGRGIPIHPQQPSSPQNSVMVAEVLASIMGTIIRLWFLTWITKRIAMEEESIHPTQHFVWERLNDRYSRDAAALQTAISSPPLGISKRKWERHLRQTTHRHRYTAPNDWSQTFTKTVVVVELTTTDHKGSLDLSHLTEVITFVLQQHRSHAFGSNATTITTTITNGNGKDQKTQTQVLLQPKPLEIVLLLQSGGGGVGTYGLAAAQVKRLTQEPGITTTACVDMVAASGGYMIASQATQLLAAPFATLGSIGVMMEGLNFHEALQKYGIQPMVIKSGNSKNPLSSLGPVTRKDLELEQGRLEKVHDAFRQLVLQGRPVLASSSSTTTMTAQQQQRQQQRQHVDKIMDGSVFLGQEALALQLVDAVKTSEEYIMERIQAGDRVLKLHRSHRAKFGPSRRLSLLDLLPHLQSWCRNVIQWLGNNGATSMMDESSTRTTPANMNNSMSTASLMRFLQVASVMSLAKHLIQHFQQNHHHHHSR